MENKSVHGQFDESSDQEDSEANTGSQSNSLNKEFSIDNFITSGGLKLTISCRKKSCDDELEKNSKDRLVGTPGTNMMNQREKEKTSSAETLLEMDTETLHHSSRTEEDLTKTLNPALSGSKSNTFSDNSEVLGEVKSHSPTSTLPEVFDKTPSSQVEVKSEEKNTLPSYTFEIQQSMRVKQKVGDQSCAPEVHDPLLRIDTLPNVSPESGISSLDDCPFGNESPDFINIGESIMDQHTSHSSQVSSVSGISQVNNMLDAGLEKHLPHFSPEDKADNVDKAQSNESNGKPTEQALGEKSVQQTSIPELECLSSQENGAINNVEDITNVHSLSAHKHGNGVILSSPHKIAQASGRKKRGRPPKTMKSLLLKHKKSTLYSSSFDSHDVANDALISNTSLAEKILEGSNDCVVNNNNICDIVSSPLKMNSTYKSETCKKLDTPPQRASFSMNRKEKELTQDSESNPSLINKSEVTISTEQMISASGKRPRGRPRKIPDLASSDDKGSKSLSGPLISSGKTLPKSSKRKHSKRKLLFTRMKRKPQKSIQPPVTTNSQGAMIDELKQISQEDARHSEKNHGWTKSNHPKNPESSIFQDNDLDALLLSVKSSIKSQFKEDVGSDVIPNLTFDNPFALMQPPPFPKVTRPSSPRIVKPKAKRPKLHVMMRQTKRRKKKFILNKRTTDVEERLTTPPKMNVFSPVVVHEKTEKFSVLPAKKSGTFGSLLSANQRPFFTSCVQPSKILASSRLNVFRLGTGVNESHRSVTPPDPDAVESYEKRLKKRNKLLYRKSKHKNITDPVFAADLDTLLDGLNIMTISENPADNFIRVRPGEVPLPSIFRVIKIDVNRKIKERTFTPEPLTVEKPKIQKSRKDSVSPSELPATSFRPILKSGRKKSMSDASFEQHKKQIPVSDSCEQRLPPKKRHRMVNVEAPQEMDSPPVSEEDPTATKDPKSQTVKKKGKRLRKVSGQDSCKPDANQMSDKLGQQFVGQELTIDTSQGFLTCTPSLSPCPSRFSTRSSTLPSLSSLSPTSSVGFRSRSFSHHHSGKASGSSGLSLDCPLHSLSTTAATSDRTSCAECQLLEQSVASISPGSLRSGRFNLRSLPGQPTATDLSISSDRRPSSSEPSPNLKLTPVFDKSPSRCSRKRRKSSTLSGDESDSSPPRLEKNVCISPRTSQDINFYSEPPNITTSERNHISPKQIASPKAPTSSKLSLSPSVSRKKVRRVFTPKKRLPKKPQLSKKQTPVKPAPKKKCNNKLSSSFAKKSSRSVITMSCPEHEPLPLEHCSNRKLVEEIKAATTLKSTKQSESEEESGPEETILPSPVQPPRKRYQRVGLFSDFYKDSEPRKRCENMVRCRDKLTYVPSEHEFGLFPQPLHIGQFYMRQQQDFQLPYDIWWQHVHQQLPKKPEPKIKFRNIRTNVYSDAKVNHRKLEIPLCNCKPPQSGGRGCQDDCLNRMIYTECSQSTCPLGDNCGNQRIQKHEWAPGLVKVQTKDRGIGVVTKNPVKSGQFILEYLGEVVSETEFRRRMMEEYSEECHHYALHLDSGCLIDGYRMGNIGRYVNHSCQPNCEMQKWNVNGLYRMVLFALRDIEAGEELGYDYNFDPFNQETQQECRCGSSECRGVIGGKRSLGTCKQVDKVVDDYKDKRKSKCMNKKIKDKPSDSLPVQPMVKPMTLKERCYARKHRTFLVRNVDKIRNQRNPAEGLFPVQKDELNTLDCTKINALNSDIMLATLNERSVKTRLAAYTKDNPKLARRHQLAQIFDKMLTDLLSLKDKDGFSVVTPLMSLPSRKKQPQYYTIVRDPIDMSIIKQRVKTGFYDHLSTFNADIMLLFSNVELYCGPKSDLGQVIFELRHVFNCVKTDVAAQIDEILGANTTNSYMDTELARLEQAKNKTSDEPEEDIIRCICGVTRDEGLMLMCEKCSRWQHCDCVQASGTEEHYLCDRCEPRHYDPEILLIPPPSDAMPDCTHYMTLVKDEVQYAVGDCVYVMRDCKRTSSGAPLRTSHRLLATSSPDKLDVFRLDQLWKDPKGERFASGTPYLRPQETFHEPTRKFYHNELFRTPSFEIIPMELVMGKCIVMDPNTYSKGRPKGFKEQDVYICEYRVDKTAHLFHKIQKIWYPINTSKFCFDWFDKKLNMKRTFSPHEVPEEYKRKIERSTAVAPPKKEEKEVIKKEEKTEAKPAVKGNKHNLTHGKLKVDDSIKNDFKLKAEVTVNVKKGSCHKNEEMAQMLAESMADQAEKNKVKRQERKVRLNKILTKLLNNIPGKQKVDLTYLLEDEKRIRKKITK